MLTSITYPKYQNNERVSKSFLTSVEPDYFLTKTNSLFNFKKRYSEQLSYQDRSKVPPKGTALEFPSQMAYPTAYKPAPPMLDAYALSRLPRGGNRPTLQETSDPQADRAAAAVGRKNTEMWQQSLSNTELDALKRKEIAEAQREKMASGLHNKEMIQLKQSQVTA